MVVPQAQVSVLSAQQGCCEIEAARCFKESYEKYGIPTAAYEVFDNADDAWTIRKCSYPTVVRLTVAWRRDHGE